MDYLWQEKGRAGPIGVMLARCERELTAQPTSGYQTGAPALLRAAQDAVKEGKGRDLVGPRRFAGRVQSLACPTKPRNKPCGSTFGRG